MLLALSGVGACVPMDQPDGSISSGILGERRSPEAAFEDNMVAIKLRSYYMRHDKVSLANINVSVYQGAVLLTGTASSQDEIDTAVSIAKGTRGVVKVHSELKVQKESFGELTKDAWYSNQVKIRLLADEQVRGLDIHVETTKAVVYLTGMAQTVAERNRAIEIARQVEGVKEVVSYIEVNPKSQPLSTKAPPAPDKKEAGTPAPVRYGVSPEPTATSGGGSGGSGGSTVKPGAPIDSGF